MRGEHLDNGRYVLLYHVSSPYARGAHLPLIRRPHELGLIPACAGSTTGARGRVDCAWAHPRMRGEHGVQHPPAVRTSGSSPHARGAPSAAGRETSPRRLIPACAGSTTTFWRAACGARAHPRMRGEHGVQHPPAVRTSGSSPHARGAPSAAGRETSPRRLIPACAGSTTTFWRAACGARAHPRMRGEHPFQIAPNQSFIGSSPHARGARAAWTVQGLRWRLIPACAGSTSAGDPGAGHDEAHPRMRGEHVVKRIHAIGDGGSSPHARGAHRPRFVQRRLRRLIPACAGSTTRPTWT